MDRKKKLREKNEGTSQGYGEMGFQVWIRKQVGSDLARIWV